MTNCIKLPSLDTSSWIGSLKYLVTRSIQLLNIMSALRRFPEHKFSDLVDLESSSFEKVLFDHIRDGSLRNMSKIRI